MKLSLKKKTMELEVYEGMADPEKVLEAGEALPEVAFKVKVELPSKDTVQNKLMDCKRKSLVFGVNPDTEKSESAVHEEFDYIKYVTTRCVDEIKAFVDGPYDDDGVQLVADKPTISLLCKHHTPLMAHIINRIDKAAGLAEEELEKDAKN